MGRTRQFLRECENAANEWSSLTAGNLNNVLIQLPPKEVRHLRQTAFRVNILLWICSEARGTKHNTELGMVVGSITHLVDFSYDHRRLGSIPTQDVDRLVSTSINDAAHNSDLLRSLGKLVDDARAKVGFREPLGECISKMLAVQNASLAQEETLPTSGSAAFDLARVKGHSAICLYFAISDPNWDMSEADGLADLGLYLQFLDDLEDFYEDVEEGRASPVTGPWSGILVATTLLFKGLKGTQSFYGADSVEMDVAFFARCLVIFHAVIATACVFREICRWRPMPRRVLHSSKRGSARNSRRERFPVLNLFPEALGFTDAY